jgi:uncharacterized protein YegP (UPF0339 family)
MIRISIEDNLMCAKFEVMKNSKGQFYWHLKADNGEIVATSETYTTKKDSMDTINSIKKITPNATVDDKTK